MLAYEALPLLTAKRAKNSHSRRQCIMQRVSPLEETAEPVESARPNFRPEPQVSATGGSDKDEQFAYLNRFN